MTTHITLDRANLQTLVDLLKVTADEHELPTEMRVGYGMVVEVLQRLVPESPHLYGPDGCPDIPQLLKRLEAAEGALARVRAVIQRRFTTQMIVDALRGEG